MKPRIESTVEFIGSQERHKVKYVITDFTQTWDYRAGILDKMTLRPKEFINIVQAGKGA